MTKHKIYISSAADERLDQKQQAIKKAILDAIKEKDFEPKEFLPWSWNFYAANQVMSRCQGAVILAFARWLITPSNQSDVSFSLTTERNHFDGALAISHKVPLLLIVDDSNVRREGVLLEGPLPVVVWPDNAGPEWINTEFFAHQFKEWCTQVESRPHVFLGYCSKARSTALDIARYIEQVLDLKVLEYSMDFLAGGTILEQIEKASSDCACGVFLFTKDDPLEGRDGDAAPRDNVIFETGYFMHAKGKEQVLVIREEGAKMPADIGGNIYILLKDRNDISGIHTQLSHFLQSRL